MKVIFALLVLLSACMLIAAHIPMQGLSVPAVMWSGKSIFTQKNGIKCQLSQVVEGVSELVNEKSTKVVIAFVEDKLRMDEFLRHSGAFGAAPGAALKNLKSRVQSAESSMKFAGCKADTPFSTTLLTKLANNEAASVTVVYDSTLPAISGNNIKGLQSSTFMAALETGASALIDSEKINVFIVLLSEQSGSLATQDQTINTVVAKFAEVTSGDYAAIFTADAPSTPLLIKRLTEEGFADANGPVNGRKLMAVLPPFNTTESAYLYIDHYTVECQLASAFLILILFGGLRALWDLKTADHIVDIDIDKKKTL